MNWTAEVDSPPPSGRGKYSRQTLAVGVSRGRAELEMWNAVAAHKTETGHMPGQVQEYAGKTFLACSCGTAFSATKIVK